MNCINCNGTLPDGHRAHDSWSGCIQTLDERVAALEATRRNEINETPPAEKAEARTCDPRCGGPDRWTGCWTLRSVNRADTYWCSELCSINEKSLNPAPAVPKAEPSRCIPGVPAAYETMRAALANDDDYRRGWADNIAMVLHDRHGITGKPERDAAANDILDHVFPRKSISPAPESTPDVPGLCANVDQACANGRAGCGGPDDALSCDPCARESRADVPKCPTGWHTLGSPDCRAFDDPPEPTHPVPPLPDVPGPVSDGPTGGGDGVSHDEAIEALLSLHGAVAVTDKAMADHLPRWGGDVGRLRRYIREREAAERAAGRGRADLIAEAEQLRADVARFREELSEAQRDRDWANEEVRSLRAQMDDDCNDDAVSAGPTYNDGLDAAAAMLWAALEGRAYSTTNERLRGLLDRVRPGAGSAGGSGQGEAVRLISGLLSPPKYGRYENCKEHPECREYGGLVRDARAFVAAAAAPAETNVEE